MYLNKITNLVIISSIFFCINIHMEKPQQQEIPRSIIKGGGGIGADLSALNGKGKILFVSPKCSVIGLGDLPYMLFITPEFREENLPPDIRRNIYEIKKLVVQPTFVAVSKSAKFCIIPKWLVNFKKIEYLRLAYVDLDDLNCLKDLPIQHLIIENIKYNDSKKLVTAIKKFKHLKEISYDQSLPADLRHSIQELNLKLTPVSS